MKIVAHRCNTIQELCEISPEYGIEIDLRTYMGDIILNHDPYIDAENIEAWLCHYKHNLLILNVKEEGLENKLIDLMSKHNINEYFLLDQSFPFLVKYAKNGHKKAAVRLSEYESIDTVMTLKGMVDWVWIDCFTKLPINSTDAQFLKSCGFKICIVSPELHGWGDEKNLSLFIEQIKGWGFLPDAVCTKKHLLWKELSLKKC